MESVPIGTTYVHLITILFVDAAVRTERCDKRPPLVQQMKSPSDERAKPCLDVMYLETYKGVALCWFVVTIHMLRDAVGLF